MIIEYKEDYLEEVRDLLVELEEYIVSLDKDHLDRIHENYWKKAPLLALKEGFHPRMMTMIRELDLPEGAPPGSPVRSPNWCWRSPPEAFPPFLTPVIPDREAKNPSIPAGNPSRKDGVAAKFLRIRTTGQRSM